MKLESGLYVRHAHYGCGVITATDADRTSIHFDAFGPKKFVTGMLVVEPAAGTPPKLPRAKRAPKRAPVAPATEGTKGAT